MEPSSAGGRPFGSGGAVGSWCGPVGAVLSALLAGNSAVAATVAAAYSGGWDSSDGGGRSGGGAGGGGDRGPVEDDVPLCAGTGVSASATFLHNDLRDGFLIKVIFVHCPMSLTLVSQFD